MLQFIIIFSVILLLFVLFKTSKDKKKEKGELWLKTNLPEYNDYLGEAANYKKLALLAVKNKEYNKAWELFNKQKECFMKHAIENKFSADQVLELDASCGENLANILRLEGKHTDALVHIIYWIATSSKTTKTQEKKLRAYFNRANLTDVDISQVNQFINKKPDCRQIRDQISEWKG